MLPSCYPLVALALVGICGEHSFEQNSCDTGRLDSITMRLHDIAALGHELRAKSVGLSYNFELV